jgi:hypothetical protein
MSVLELIKGYYKVAVPIAALIILKEELFSKDAFLNHYLKRTILGPGQSAELYLSLFGGGKQEQGPHYFDQLVVPVYQGQTGKELPLKQFMVNHVTKYQAALFEGLVDDWPALNLWNINSDEGVTYLTDAFGDDFLLEIVNCRGNLYAPHRKSSQIEYSTFGEYVALINNRSENNKYVTKGGAP